MRTCITWLDRSLRSRQGIFEYCRDEQCLLRVAVAPCPATLTLPDGTIVTRGDPILELHLWNEHLHDADRRRSRLGWGVGLRTRLRHSLTLLAAWLRARDDLPAMSVCHGRFAAGAAWPGMRDLLRSEGFFITSREPSPWLSGLRDSGEDLLTWALMWTFNPAALPSLSGSGRPLHRLDLWMSLATLEHRYGAVGPARPEGRRYRPRPVPRPAAAVARGLTVRPVWRFAATSPALWSSLARLRSSSRPPAGQQHG